jgi:hypothetical protein
MLWHLTRSRVEPAAQFLEMEHMMQIAFKINLTSGEITVETECFDGQSCSALQAVFVRSLLARISLVEGESRDDSQPVSAHPCKTCTDRRTER